MTESRHSDFDRAVERTQRAVAALLQGDPEPEKELWSRRDDVTLANPFGGYRRGWGEVEAGLDLAADGFANGGTCVFEEISWEGAPTAASSSRWNGSHPTSPTGAAWPPARFGSS
jgi:hypothetical protein